MVPSKASAAMAMVSDRVGWGWMVSADVGGVGAHLDGQGGLGDQVAGVGADDAAADDPLGGLVEQHLGHALVAAQRQRPAADAAHGNTPLPYLIPAALASFSVSPTQATSGSV